MNTIKSYQNYFTITIFLIFLGSATIIVKNTTLYPYGDGVEYILTTESLANHFSPDLRVDDIEKYKSFHKKYKPELHKEEVYNDIKKLIEDGSKPLENTHGFYKAENGKVYSYHFWLYSLTTVPTRLFLEYAHLDITYSFIITNYLILLLVLLLVFTAKNIVYYNKIWLTLFITISPIFWYLHWPHPEAFTSLMVFASIVLFIDKRHYISIFLMSVACTHNPPLFIPILIMIFFSLKEKGITIRNIVFVGLSSSIIILPSLFYYYHFSVPNLIVNSGFLSKDHITLKKLYSFFFDLNQGMVLGVNIVLILSFFIFIYRLLKKKTTFIDYMYISVFLMAYFYLQMRNWSHGMSVINRYAVWNSVFIILFVVWSILNYNSKAKKFILLILLVAQSLSIYYFSNIKQIDWSSTSHNKIAMWFFDNYPELYNPEPHIFQVRTNKANLSYTETVIVHNRPDSVITKMMIFNADYRANYIEQLLLRGIKKENIDKFLSENEYYHEWIYINKSDLDKMGYNQAKDTLIPYLEGVSVGLMVEEAKQAILSNPTYKKLIEEKAKQQDITFEQAMENDANYVVKLAKENAYKR
jgi:hypothetical protein